MSNQSAIIQGPRRPAQNVALVPFGQDSEVPTSWVHPVCSLRGVHDLQAVDHTPGQMCFRLPALRRLHRLKTHFGLTYEIEAAGYTD